MRFNTPLAATAPNESKEPVPRCAPLSARLGNELLQP